MNAADLIGKIPIPLGLVARYFPPSAKLFGEVNEICIRPRMERDDEPLLIQTALFVLRIGNKRDAPITIHDWILEANYGGQYFDTRLRESNLAPSFNDLIRFQNVINLAAYARKHPIDRHVGVEGGLCFDLIDTNSGVGMLPDVAARLSFQPQSQGRSWNDPQDREGKKSFRSNSLDFSGL